MNDLHQPPGEHCPSCDEKSVPPRLPVAAYYPLILLLAFILGGCALREFIRGEFDSKIAMSNFMGGFFVVFSFFKFLDVSGFADAFRMYDLAAKRSRLYAVSYPAIELVLGVLFLTGLMPIFADAATLLLMLVGAAGVLNSLRKGEQIQCACLGEVFKLPMSTVTLIEDLAMAAMAALALLQR